MKTINFIGCGKLGKTIALLFKTKKAAKILGVCNTSLESSKNAVNFIGEGNAYENLNNLPLSDIIFITTRDDEIQSTCEKYSLTKNLKPGSIVTHCSGSLSSEILISAKKAGCYIASIHPIKSFANPGQCIHHFKNTHCGVEGDKEAIEILTTLFKKIGGIVFDIPKEHKILYHAASVFANNYLTTLHSTAVECYLLAGVNEKIAKKIVSMLMQDALTNIEKSSHQKALTGPLQRGDVETIKNHIISLQHHPILKELYIELGKKTVELSEHPEEKIQAFKEIFAQNSGKFEL